MFVDYYLKEELSKACKNFAHKYKDITCIYDEPQRVMEEVGAFLTQTLPAEIQHSLKELRQGHDLTVVSLRGLPVDDRLPRPPAKGERPVEKKTFVTEAMLLGLAKLLTLEPVGYEQEKKGEYIHQVTPVRGHEGQKSNEGASDLKAHTEAAHHECPPDYMMLYGLRGHQSAQTILWDMELIFNVMAPEDVKKLAQPLFQLRASKSFGQHKVIKTPLIFHDNGTRLVRLDLEEVSGINKEGEELINKIEHLMQQPEYQQKYVIGPGDLIILNNKRVAHGRCAFEVDFEDKHRWLQRVYLTSALSQHPTVKERPRTWI